MQINLITLGIGLALLFFVYFFGLFEGRGQGYKRRRKEEDEQKMTPAAMEAPLPSSAPPSENSLLRLSVNEGNQLRLDIDSQRVDTSQLAPEQRKRLIELMMLMRPWIEAGASQKTAPPVTAPAPPPPVLATSVARTVPPPPPKPASGRAAPASKEEAAAPTSMVGQIDAILQVRMIGTPLESRSIRLVESAEGGVVVMVGTERYGGVGEVPDPAVQAAIRAAIAEWERKYTPG